MNWKWIARRFIQINLMILIVPLLLFISPKGLDPMINHSTFILTMFIAANIGGAIGLMIRILDEKSTNEDDN